MDEIFVSVIVPAYNVEKYISRCLNSLTKQSLKNLEIIVIDDGSEDNTSTIIEYFAKQDSRIKMFKQTNQGQATTRNFGVELAKGEFISFIDSDDYVDETFFEKLYYSAKENNAEIACAGIIRENNKKKKFLVEYAEKKLYKSTKDKCKNAGLPESCYVCNKIYKRESLVSKKIKFRDGYVYEDMIYTPEVLSKLENLVTVPDVYYHYWKNPKSTITIDTDRTRANKFEAHEFLRNFCNKNGVKLPEKCLTLKKEIYIFGIKVIKLYQYRTFCKYYLFGIIPFMLTKNNI